MPLADIDLLDPDMFIFGPPHGLFAQLRQEAPVHLHHRPGLPPFWVITRHRDVVRVSTDPATFSSAANGAFLDEVPDGPRNEPSPTMPNLDGPAHDRLRGLVARAFTAEAVARLERRVQSICTTVVDRVARSGECDFVQDVAAEFSLAVHAMLLGFPDDEDRRHVARQTGVLSAPLEQPAPTAPTRAIMNLFEFAHELARWRRTAPGDDLVSMLVHGPDRLSRREFELTFLLLLTAGHLTAQHAISGAMQGMLEQPQEWRRLCADPSLLNTGVDEMLRWASPVMQFQRTATRDTTIADQPIKSGDRVALYYISANRDETVFPNPNQLNLTRTPNPHVTFGAGSPHHCLGNHLAKLMIHTIFTELPRRIPDIQLTEPPTQLTSTFVNAPRTMPITFTPTRQS